MVESFSFIIDYTGRGSARSSTHVFGSGRQDAPSATLVGFIQQEERGWLEEVLLNSGFQLAAESHAQYQYSFSKATGMLKLQQSTSIMCNNKEDIPQWIPLVQNEENVLVANGWSFLDPDESDPLSAFDIDAANLEGLYEPKWKTSASEDEVISQLGFSLRSFSRPDVEGAYLQSEPSRQVLLQGATDPPGTKVTHNGVSFAGSVHNVAIDGVFCCAIGNLPLFAARDLSPLTASSGWLSFVAPISEDHVELIHPLTDEVDQRIEVICAKTKCHLGHYFGKGNGYCINASALNFYGANDFLSQFVRPISWKSLHERAAWLHDILLRQTTPVETLLLGAGCFWHVEFALARLPGVISTEVGYAGGTQDKPTYELVCQGVTGHAEVCKVDFDPAVLDPRILLDCFLAMHDPTKVRAHGRHATTTGQYRSCVVASTYKLLQVAQVALDECQEQLTKDLATEIYHNAVYWPAEERHQRHEERRGNSSTCDTLSVTNWLLEYGRRQEPVMGSASTLNSVNGI